MTYLNLRRVFTRHGARCGVGQVHRILTRKTYVSEHAFNKRAKNKALTPTTGIVVARCRRSSTKRRSMPCRHIRAHAIRK